MRTKKSAIKTVERFVKEVRSSGIRVRKAVLFGSFAYGKTHKWSDIKVALVADEFKGVDDARKFSSIRIKPEFVSISTHTYNAKDFTPRIDPFVEVIMEKGIEINFKWINYLISKKINLIGTFSLNCYNEKIDSNRSDAGRMYCSIPAGPRCKTDQ